MSKVFFHVGCKYCIKGLSSIEYNDRLLKDDGKGNLLDNGEKIGRINYKDGTITIKPKTNSNYFNSNLIKKSTSDKTK